MGISRVTRSFRSVSSKKLLDEGNHLWLLDGSGIVLVEGGEDLVKGFVGELFSSAKIAESVLHELLGLLFVKFANLVTIISVPDLLDNA